MKEETGTLIVTATKDEGNMRRMLDLIAYNCRIGHSFGVIVDPEDPRRQKFYFDGDGATRVSIVPDAARAAEEER